MTETTNSNPGAAPGRSGKSVRRFCPACGSRLEPECKFCPACGRELERSPVEAKSAPPPEEAPAKPQQTEEVAPQPAPKPEPARPRCTCGEELPERANFCLRCGQSIKGPSLRLVHLNPDGLNQVVPIGDGEVTIGKAPNCDVVLQGDGYVSRKHAKVRRESGQVWLEDLHSSNGTFHRLREALPLEDGDEILVGANLFRVERDKD
jgi:FHA domain-containing protein/zinc ribbon protein